MKLSPSRITSLATVPPVSQLLLSARQKPRAQRYELPSPVQSPSSAHGSSQNALTADSGQDGSVGRDATGMHAPSELSASQGEFASQVLVHVPQRQLKPPTHVTSVSQRFRKFVSLPISRDVG